MSETQLQFDFMKADAELTDSDQALIQQMLSESEKLRYAWIGFANMLGERELNGMQVTFVQWYLFMVEDIMTTMNEQMSRVVDLLDEKGGDTAHSVQDN